MRREMTGDQKGHQKERRRKSRGRTERDVRRAGRQVRSETERLSTIYDGVHGTLVGLHSFLALYVPP